MVQNATDGGGGGSDFHSPTYRNLAEQAAAKRAAARKFDEWADTVASFVGKVEGCLERDGEGVWTGPSATPFYDEFRSSSAFGKKIPGYKAPYHDTADNLRRTAKALEEDKELAQWASM